MFGNDGDAYEMYMGRWSRLVAPRFLNWLGISASSRWLDVGSGTGNLSQAILDRCDPSSAKGVESSEGFVEQAKQVVQDRRVTFEAGDAQSLAVESASVESIDVDAHFHDFDDYWMPFTGNQGSAPRYIASLDDGARAILREKLRSTLPFSADGSLDLIARAWSVRGKKPST
jgi:SAM-dependent methyltransferase